MPKGAVADYTAERNFSPVRKGVYLGRERISMARSWSLQFV
jgi:hypothetical protein